MALVNRTSANTDIRLQSSITCELMLNVSISNNNNNRLQTQVETKDRGSTWRNHRGTNESENTKLSFGSGKQFLNHWNGKFLKTLRRRFLGKHNSEPHVHHSRSGEFENRWQTLCFHLKRPENRAWNLSLKFKMSFKDKPVGLEGESSAKETV